MKDFSKEITNSFGRVSDKLFNWLDLVIVNLPNLILSLLIAVIGFFLGKLIKKVAIKFTSRFTTSPTVLNLIGNISNVLFVLITLFLILGVFDLNSTINKILATAGVLGIAIGLALQDPMMNLFSGVMMSVRNLYKIGDIVETNGFLGKISDISLRSTTLTLFSGQEVTIPNKEVIQKPLTNYSVNGLRRVSVKVGVSYGSDLEKVKEVALEAIKSIDMHIQNKPTEVFFHTFSDSSIDCDIRFWHLFKDQTDFLETQSEAIIAIKKAFDAHDISIPFPIRTLDFGIDPGVPLSEMLPDNDGHKK